MTARSMSAEIDALSSADGAALLRDAGFAQGLPRDWLYHVRRDQRPPPGDWSAWLVMAGRGFGKTRTGAEWVRRQALDNPGARIAIVGATMAEARAVMVEGESGLLATARPADQLLFAPSLDRVRWGNGAQGRLFSAADPEALRGAQHGFAWADEIAKWPGGERAWDNLILTLRQGRRPRVVATTTPRPVDLMRRLLADPRVVVTRGATADNARNLSRAFLAEVTARYGGTRLGRQELDGELIEDVEGALWTRAMVEAARAEAVGRGNGGAGSREQGAEGREKGANGTNFLASPSSPLPAPCSPLPELTRIVIAVDPPASATGDACGIVACGLDRAGIGHVLEDASVAGASPERWARAVAECAARWGADRVIAEANNGGEMVRSTLRAFDPGLPVVLAHASRGKGARAEPVALLYQQGRVRHRGVFPELEDQLCGLTPGGYVGPGRSPDRADALVWALTELMVRRKRAVPRVRAV